MAAKGMSVGIDEEVQKLMDLSDAASQIASYALFAGADVIADAVRAAINSLPVDSDDKHPFSGPLHVITAQDKADLAAGIGIAKHGDTGDGRSTAVGINGYSTRKEKGFPNGVPLVMIARSIESGNSVRSKNPFWRRAERAAAGKAEQAMQEAANEIVEQIIQGR